MNKADKETLSAIIQTQIGVSKKLKGYQYLEDAVEIALKNPQMPVMQIYQLLGNQHGRSAVSIERTLRYAIETAYDKDTIKWFFSQFRWETVQFRSDLDNCRGNQTGTPLRLSEGLK